MATKEDLAKAKKIVGDKGEAFLLSKFVMGSETLTEFLAEVIAAERGQPTRYEIKTFNEAQVVAVDRDGKEIRISLPNGSLIYEPIDVRHAREGDLIETYDGQVSRCKDSTWERVPILRCYRVGCR